MDLKVSPFLILKLLNHCIYINFLIQKCQIITKRNKQSRIIALPSLALSLRQGFPSSAPLLKVFDLVNNEF